MTRFVIDEAAFLSLVKGETLIAGLEIEIAITPTLGWLRMVEHVVAAARAGEPSPITRRLGPSPPDPPEAREFLPRRR